MDERGQLLSAAGHWGDLFCAQIEAHAYEREFCFFNLVGWEGLEFRNRETGCGEQCAEGAVV